MNILNKFNFHVNFDLNVAKSYVFASVACVTNRIKSVPVQYKSAALTCLTVYVSYRLHKLVKKQMRMNYANRLADRFEREMSFVSDGGGGGGDEDCDRLTLGDLKKKYIFDMLTRIAVKKNALKVVELGYCGGNFKYIPPGCFVTLCNRLSEFEPYLKSHFLKYSKHLWFYNDTFLNNLSCLRSNSVDVIFCTHYLSSVENLDNTFEQIYRVLKPVS